MTQQPIFQVGPNGPLQLDVAWRSSVSEFCSGMKKAVGKNANSQLRPYRLGCTCYIAFDVRGEAGEVNVTLVESGANRLPDAATICSVREVECELVDLIDAYYLVTRVLASLEAL